MLDILLISTKAHFRILELEYPHLAQNIGPRSKIRLKQRFEILHMTIKKSVV